MRNGPLNGGPFFVSKISGKKFFGVPYFQRSDGWWENPFIFRRENFREKFFGDAYFRGAVYPVDFSLFLGGHFLG